MINFNYPWEEEEEDFSAKGYLDSWELAKKAMYCPSSLEARRMLGLGSEEFAELLKIPVRDVWNWESGRGSPSVKQQITIKELLKLDGERMGTDEIRTKLDLTSAQIAELLGISEEEERDIRFGRKSLNLYHKLILKRALSHAKKKGLIE